MAKNQLQKDLAGKFNREIERIRQQLSSLVTRQPSLKAKASNSSASLPEIDWGALKAAYASTPVSKEDDTFLFCRIIGNDLPPRHEEGQTLRNIKFILEHEPAFSGCTKHWLLNRIASRDVEREIIDALDANGQSYMRLPFDLSQYAKAQWDLDGIREKNLSINDGYRAELTKEDLSIEARTRRLKNLYAMNNNGARNTALSLGASIAKWILPWDGNCFLTNDAWETIRSAIIEKPYIPYHIVPMARVTDNANLRQDTFAPPALEEPQIIFRRDSSERFNELYPYGHRPKVELLWRLGVPGIWDRFHQREHDLPRPDLSPDAGQYSNVGWVARLSSGREALETGDFGGKKRKLARDESIILFLDDLDRKVIDSSLRKSDCVFYGPEELASLAAGGTSEQSKDLEIEAAKAQSQGFFSVMDKPAPGPSGVLHDYYHPAPYWWPNPNGADGLPYIYRDGQRIPGTKIFEPGSELYDRSNLQRLFLHTTILALASHASGNRAFSNHAAKLIETWFVNPATRMSPHLRFAQVKRGHNNNEGAGRGIIEFKDVYYFLDGVRLVVQSGALSSQSEAALKDWFRQYLEWLIESPQGKFERQALNNHGIFYDLQVASIALFVNDASVVAATMRRTQERVFQHFLPDGSQPHELKRADALHYSCFNLQGWIYVSRLLSCVGFDLWNYTTSDGRCLRTAIEWLLNNAHSHDWPYSQTASFDYSRLVPIAENYLQFYGSDDVTKAIIETAKVEPEVLHPDYAIIPYRKLLRTLHSQSSVTLSP